MSHWEGISHEFSEEAAAAGVTLAELWTPADGQTRTLLPQEAAQPAAAVPARRGISPPGFHGTKEFNWLTARAQDYGFILR